MYKFYVVPDAAALDSHADIYTGENLKLFWDPYAESDAYAIVEPQWKEELNKSGSLEFTVLPSNIHYNDFHKKKSVVVVLDEGNFLFEGVVSDAPVDFFKQRKVTVVDPMSYLCDSIQAPDEKNVIEVPVSSTDKKYLPVPAAWYASASPKALNWYEQTIIPTYTAVEATDIFRSYETYYVNNNGVYTPNVMTEAGWSGRPQLYTVNGEEVKYNKSNDTSANTSKNYFYEFSGDGRSYTGTTTTSKAATKESIIDHIKRLLNVHNSQVDPFKRIFAGSMYNSSDTEKHEFKSSGYRTTWDALKSDILDNYGKYFHVTRHSDNLLYLDYVELAQLPSSSVPLIEFANNMVEFSEADNSDDDIFTVLVPIGKNNLTVEKVTGHDNPANGNNAEVSPYVATFGGNKRYVVVSPKAVQRYGYIFKTVSMSDVSNASTLYSRAVKYIQNNYDFHTEYEAKAIDLRFINGSGHRIRVGDHVRVHSTWHGVDDSSMYVISAEHDLVNPENDSYKIGVPTSDREANNRTLTGQTNNTSSKSSSNYASAQSAIDNFASKLAALMDIDDWGIKAHTNIENKVESNDQMYNTRFLQNEELINLSAQKLFGPAWNDDKQQDAGYIRVPVSDYKKSSGAYKNPTEEVWYEYLYSDEAKKNIYTRSVKETCDPSVYPGAAFYIQRLWSRYSDIEVGPGGIKARVDGNYERSVASSSWITMNEDSILALTGHIYVDEDGHVHLTSGSGMRTDHQEDRTDPAFILVPSTMYKDVYGNDVKPYWGSGGKNWYECATDASGKWLGQDQEDAATNPAYYKVSTDTTVDRSKHYYYKSYIREEFRSEFGVYDEDNLKAGILVRMINNPTYKKVYKSELDDAIAAGTKLRNLGWYEYDKNTGLYGLPQESEMDKAPSLALYKSGVGYYTATNNERTYTAVMGDHVVIGGRLDADGNPVIFGGVDDATKARIQKYMSANNLDGTITEIASDVLYAKAIFTNYMNVFAQKLIGNASDDANFEPVDKTQAGYADMNPSAEGWCEKNAETNEYFLTADDKVDMDKTYYVTHLMKRITSLVVGPDGIHGTVSGNYERSIKSQAWLEANEEKLEFLVGRVGQDADGNLVIDAGSGFRSGYTQATNTQGRYVLTLRSQYATTNPKNANWKEKIIGADGLWTGQGKSDSDTNSAYYKTSNDTSADYTKQYYVWSTTAETFTAEYGVYHEGNLSAGVVAQMVNFPKYKAIDLSKQPADQKSNPSTATKVTLANGQVLNNKFWMVYDSANGAYGRTTDTSVVNGHVYYYSADSVGYKTDLIGDHIVIGPQTTPTSMTDDEKKDESLQNRINRYIGNKHLNGTICEIASDVVQVNALFARYIETDYLCSDQNELNTIYCNHILCRNSVQSMGDVYINVGSKLWSGGRALGNAIEGFGTPTYSGDNVSIPFYTVNNPYVNYQGSESSASGTLTFTKPASLGSVTWSSGNNTLTAKTVGGTDFLVGEIKGFAPSGSSEAAAMANAGYLATETTGYSQVYGIYYTKKDANNNDVTGKTMLFKTPKNRYPDAVSTIKTWSDTDKTDGDSVDLDKDESIKIYAQYKTEVQYDAESGDDDSKKGNTDKSGITVTAVSAYNTGWDNARLQMDWPSVMQALGERTSLTIKYPSDTVGNQSSTTFTLLDEDTKGSSGYVRVYRGYQDNNNRGNLIGAIQVGDWYTNGKSDGRSGTSISSPSTATAPQGASVTNLSSYGQVYEVHKVFGGSSDGGTIYFKTPSDNAVSITDVGIYDGDTRRTSITMSVNGSKSFKGGYKADGTLKTDGSCTIYGPSLSSTTLYYSEKEKIGTTTYYYYYTTTNLGDSSKGIYY